MIRSSVLVGMLLAAALASPSSDLRAATLRQDNSLSIEWLKRLEQRPERAEIELVTVQPGEEIYTRFGHTMLRVRERGSFDMTYNFGVFDFSDPSFVLNYARGFLTYRLVVVGYDDVVKEAEREGRALMTYPLDLRHREVRVTLAELRRASLPQHQFYSYHYFANNCATRIRDILERATDGALAKAWRTLPTELTYRQGLREGLAPFSVLNFLLDFVLNATNDQTLSAWEASYHPLVLARLLASVPLPNGRFLVSEGRLALPGQEPERFFALGPAGMHIAIFALLLGAWLLWRSSRGQVWIAALWSAYAGLMATLLLLVWLGTAHDPVQGNGSLWLVWPTDLVAALGLVFWQRKAIRWLGWYALAHTALAVCYGVAKLAFLAPQANAPFTVGSIFMWALIASASLRARQSSAMTTATPAVESWYNEEQKQTGG